MKICFILDHDLKDYRKPFFQQLADKELNILIVHPGQELLGFSSRIEQISIQAKKKFGLEIRKSVGLKGIDVVIHMQNIRLLSLWKLTLSPFRNYKIIHWGIGTSSSNGLTSESKFVRTLRNFVSYFADAQVLYSDFALNKYPVIVQKKTFIANNTVESLYSEDFSGYEKDSFLFIGFLNRRKGLKILIEAFKTYFDSGNRNIKKMIIVDDGPEKKKITGMVNQLGIQLNVIFLGNIND